MTSFIYIADTHLGAAPMGYQKQQGTPENLPAILDALKSTLVELGKVDFILHGGDLIDTTTDEQIKEAVETFTLPVPVYLCLGNHDLTTPNAAERWLELAPQFFNGGGSAEFCITTDDCVIHVVPNHWEDRSYYWAEEQNAHFKENQLLRLRAELALSSHLPHFLLTHSAVFGLPVEQTGFSEPYHCPPPAFTKVITQLAAESPHLICVLGAHTHMNMRCREGNADYATVSSLSETPFEFKHISVEAGRISMTTLSLEASIPERPPYDQSSSYVQGRAIDRAFVKEWPKK